MDYERLKYWKERAEADPSDVLAFLAASHEALIGVFAKHKRVTALAFAVVAALMFYHMGFTEIAGVVGRIVK